MVGSLLEKCGKIWENGLWPDWGNTAWAATGIGVYRVKAYTFNALLTVCIYNKYRLCHFKKEYACKTGTHTFKPLKLQIKPSAILAGGDDVIPISLTRVRQGLTSPRGQGSLPAVKYANEGW